MLLDDCLVGLAQQIQQRHCAQKRIHLYFVICKITAFYWLSIVANKYWSICSDLLQKLHTDLSQGLIFIFFHCFIILSIASLYNL